MNKAPLHEGELAPESARKLLATLLYLGDLDLYVARDPLGLVSIVALTPVEVAVVRREQPEVSLIAAPLLATDALPYPVDHTSDHDPFTAAIQAEIRASFQARLFADDFEDASEHDLEDAAEDDAA